MACVYLKLSTDYADALFSFISGAAMANAYGGALAYGLSHIKASLDPWQILFIIESLPTCLMAIVVYFYLADSLAATTFLTEREKHIAAASVARNREADPDRKSGFHIKEGLLAFKEPKGTSHPASPWQWKVTDTLDLAYIPGIMYFSINVSFASLPLFVLTIIAQMGTFSKIQSNGP